MKWGSATRRWSASSEEKLNIGDCYLRCNLDLVYYRIRYIFPCIDFKGGQLNSLVKCLV